MNEDVQNALLEGIWVMRWNDEKTSKSSVLTTDEALQACDDIVKELGAAGYEIVKK